MNNNPRPIPDYIRFYRAMLEINLILNVDDHALDILRKLIEENAVRLHLDQAWCARIVYFAVSTGISYQEVISFLRIMMENPPEFEHKPQH